VSFTFDDFPASAAQEGAGLLERRGWHGTFYLAPGLLDQDTAVGRICSMRDVERLHQDGHEIGSHTFSHTECQRARRSTLLQEIQSSARELEPFDGGRNFALPYGAHDAASLNFLSGRFDTIRTVEAGVNCGEVDLNLLSANPIYESSDLGELRTLIGQTQTLGAWLIFYTHDVHASPSRYGCTADRLQTVLGWVSEAGLAVRTVAQTYELLGPEQPAGNEVSTRRSASPRR
jgi:peptidoglycan/xylan/chitin deacetylase (PgdA/CDA1 family)